jgi:hypothetical protein
LSDYVLVHVVYREKQWAEMYDGSYSEVLTNGHREDNS